MPGPFAEHLLETGSWGVVSGLRAGGQAVQGHAFRINVRTLKRQEGGPCRSLPSLERRALFRQVRSRRVAAPANRPHSGKCAALLAGQIWTRRRGPSQDGRATEAWHAYGTCSCVRRGEPEWTILSMTPGRSPEVIPMPAPADTTERPIDSLSREERIRRRAQEFFRLRGDRPGSAIDDWLRAEEEIREAEEHAVDAASEDSFPASDPRTETQRGEVKRNGASCFTNGNARQDHARPRSENRPTRGRCPSRKRPGAARNGA
jgi:Protein of unknown function (DUF2934)